MPASDTMYSDWLAQANFIQTQWKFRDNVQFPFLGELGIAVSYINLLRFDQLMVAGL
jgi:hypothetical protein